jgi:hypothetical protein
MLSKNGFHPSRNITDEIYVSSIILCHPLLCENGFHWGLSYTIYLFIFPFLPFKKPKKYKSTMILVNLEKITKVAYITFLKHFLSATKCSPGNIVWPIY